MLPASRPLRGFTLIEVLVTVAIVAILGAIVMPIYKDYVVRGRLTDATTGLATMRAQMERYYQDNRTYADVNGFVSPCHAGDDSTRTYGSFLISCKGDPTATTFVVQAVGSGPMDGYTYTINQLDVRATAAIPAVWGSQCATKWIIKKGDTC